jgi:polyisoprenoid-binding protein YceI
MLRKLFALAVATLFAVPAFAAETTYKLSGDNTKVTFTGTKPGGKHDGGFAKLAGTATVADGTITKIEVEIDCDSLYSDDPTGKLTAHLKSPDFFGVKDNPKSTFKTTKIEKTDKGYNITGDLTLLGKTKAVTFPATVTEKDGTLTLTSSEFQIDRTEWGMVFGKGKVDDKVSLKVALTAKK